MDPVPLRVLIIDDSEDDALILQRRLRAAGYAADVRRVQTALELGAALRDRAWDLALCDYRMPGFGGPAALYQVRAHSPGLPFIFVSGTLPPESAGIVSKADGFVSKDRPEDVIDTIRKRFPPPGSP